MNDEDAATVVLLLRWSGRCGTVALQRSTVVYPLDFRGSECASRWVSDCRLAVVRA